MKKLFLTGAVGCGKSTAIRQALGDDLPKAGGFLTVRQKDDTGRAVAYWLTRPDGSDGQVIIDYSNKPYRMHLEVFESTGVALLERSGECPFVILDEIGGFEVLSDAFLDALKRLLERDIPVIGVMKGAAPASKMIRKLGLGEEYVRRAEQLREFLRSREDTLLYECSQFDPEGLRLARAWAEENI